MTKKEMLEHIEAELLEAITHFNNSSEKSKNHVLKFRADSFLAMIEGFGMLPPFVPPKNGCYIIPKIEWETEDESN